MSALVTAISLIDKLTLTELKAVSIALNAKLGVETSSTTGDAKTTGKTKKPRVKKEKDPNAEKKLPTAYLVWSKETYNKYKAEVLEEDEELAEEIEKKVKGAPKKLQSATQKKMSEIWKGLSKEEQSKWSPKSSPAESENEESEEEKEETVDAMSAIINELPSDSDDEEEKKASPKKKTSSKKDEPVKVESDKPKRGRKASK
jgi:hypothetical protein